MSAVLKELAEGIVKAVNERIDGLRTAMTLRINDLEARINSMPAPQKGEKGDRGEPGMPGERGADGAPGRDGVAGKDGADGLIGPMGPAGAKGDPGERGEIGPQGPAGEPGKDGAAGRDGKDGAPGVDGKDGVPGPQGERGQPGPAGKDGIDGINGKDGAPGRDGKDGQPGRDGKDFDPELVRGMLAEMVKSAVSDIPKPKDGAPGRDGAPGKDADPIHPDTVALMIREAVDKAVDAIPKPQNGRDAAQLEILPALDATKSYPRGTWVKHAGGLIRSLRDTDPVTGSLELAGWEIAVDGVAGIACTQDEADPRKFTIASMLTSGKQAITEAVIPVMLHRGIWKDGGYTQGDVVTWDGSQWHCLAPTDTKPGTSKDWQLVVKRGRDGKDFRPEDPPKPREPVHVK